MQYLAMLFTLAAITSAMPGPLDLSSLKSRAPTPPYSYHLVCTKKFTASCRGGAVLDERICAAKCGCNSVEHAECNAYDGCSAETVQSNCKSSISSSSVYLVVRR